MGKKTKNSGRTMRFQYQTSYINALRRHTSLATLNKGRSDVPHLNVSWPHLWQITSLTTFDYDLRVFCHLLNIISDFDQEMMQGLFSLLWDGAGVGDPPTEIEAWSLMQCCDLYRLKCSVFAASYNYILQTCWIILMISQMLVEYETQGQLGIINLWSSDR